MIKRKVDMKTEKEVNMKKGNGKIEIAYIWDKNELSSHSRFIGRLKIDVGSSIGLHQHVNEEEIYYIMQGTGIVEDNGHEYTIESGDSLYTKSGEYHSIKNTGTAPIEMIAIILTN